jgi:ARG and Rhodanese-Phosphatase-superfamily-associated Protein domain
MRRRTFMGFVACCAALLPVGSSVVAAADGLRVSGPIVHDNLAIYFLHGTTTGDAVPVSLEEAIAKGRVKVRETGSVNELTMENVGDDEIFVQPATSSKAGDRTASCPSICCCRRIQE